MKKKTNIDKRYIITDYYNKSMLERVAAHNPWTTDIEVTETVPRYYISIPIPYIKKSYNDEGDRNDDQWVFGFIWRTLFTFGKKIQKRFLYSWEVPNKKRKNSVINFKRYGELDANKR